LEIAEILADLKLDRIRWSPPSLSRRARRADSAATVSQRFGPVVAKLIDGVLRMAAISASLSPRQSMVLGTQGQVENLRKMLVAMVDDVRVALIKLAERTCAIRAVKTADDEKRNRVAREVFDIYAPLAHRLGIGHIKWELEDLSFRYLEPDQYKQIATLLHERRLDRERFISDVMNQLRTSCRPPASTPTSAAGPNTSIRSGAKCSARAWNSARSTTCAPCACWSRKCATATPRWASSTPCGGTSPKSSTTTSPTPRRTATARCTRR
jgi:hypothetical protein